MQYISVIKPSPMTPCMYRTEKTLGLGTNSDVITDMDAVTVTGYLTGEQSSLLSSAVVLRSITSDSATSDLLSGGGVQRLRDQYDFVKLGQLR